MTRYIENLQQTEACKAATVPNLMVCTGSRNDPISGAKIAIFFFIPTDTNNKLIVPASDIPVHSRCETDGKRTICFVSDDFDGGASIKFVILPNAQITAPEILRVHQKIVDFAATRRP